MKFIKYLLSLAMMAGVFLAGTLSAQQDGSRFDEELNERDFDALRDFLKTKRAVDVADEGTSNLTISGDVRTEWRHLNETCRHQRLRGHGTVGVNGRPISRNDFDIEFNLRFDYVCDQTWAVAHIRYDNSAGVDDNGHPCFGTNDGKNDKCCVEQARHCLADPQGYHGSGICDDLCLKKAYMGYELYECDNTRFFVELGRRGNLYNVFDSNVQFLSRFDGILLKYQSTIECVTNWYIQAAGFVVDERVNHFAWVAEVGMLNIADMGLDLKYSIIDWEKHGTNRCFVRNPRGFRFINSQVTMAYNVDPVFFCKPIKLYGAFVVNHAAHRLRVGRHHKLANLAWYAGMLIGEVRKEGDWAFEVQYQAVQAQAMPDDDCAGICRGNVLDESFTTCSRRGNTNFTGWRLEALYAITDNLTLDSILEWSKAYDRRIGGRHTYDKFELEAIYAF